MIEIENDTAGSVTISLSVEGDKKKHFTPVVLEKPLRTRTKNMVAVGTLPCRYIKLDFGPSKVGSAVSVKGLKLIGCEQMNEECKVADVLNSA
eukprot:CAMPEP_0170454456 /NCGR_PEP_ID=MMETSP0123-20130129/2698_1 /TAXON_ID=182087 /ORGANISM="Favella ehrenbergii, Strain Fehren 1" /LENGTH=92 /DNA_ID=CAMNT_0010717167 /DNA_START=196 /DNA_END=470 /DNA_ORIENTATION=+